MSTTTTVSVENVNWYKDKTVGIHVRTLTEKHDSDLLELMQLQGKDGVFLFSESQLTTEIIKHADQIANHLEPEGKTLSERLRNVMYVLWKETINDGDFEKTRRAWMEKLIEDVKNRIPKD